MATLSRDSGGHLTANQTFTGVKAVNGKVVSIKLAGPSAGGHGDIRFAFKHILDATKKTGQTDDQKLSKRVWHRADKGGAKSDNPYPGAKSGGISRGNKYATAMKYDSTVENMKNTAIYLSLMPLDKMLTEMANALTFHPWGTDTKAAVEIEFSIPCIKTANGAGHITGPVDKCTIEFYKISDGVYEAGHLKS
jgi:hypothetical protein